ncbi:MAG: translation initiation factor IF-2 N-terminal domain-containing protein, partial [Desulfuromonas sp.]
MAKIRIYELAQRLGLGNKDLLKRLRDKGIEAKSHMSVIDEETVKEFEENITKSDTEQQETFAEERISTGLIRRRRKVQPSKEKVEEATSAEETSEDAVASTSVTKQDSEPTPTEAQAPQEAVPHDQVAAKTSVASEDKAEAVTKSEDSAVQPSVPEKQSEPESTTTDSPAPTKRAAPTKHVASIVSTHNEEPQLQKSTTKTGATILGHVELPKSALRQDQRGGRRPGPADKRKVHSGARPAAGPRPDSAPTGAPKAPAKTPAFVDVPIDPENDKGRDQRRRKKKTKGANEYAESFGGKKRERVEVYKPERLGRNRRGR